MRSVRAELLPSTGWFGSVHASEFEAELTRRASLRLGESRGEVKKAVTAAAMPSSVGMRRTTRVFGVVKGSDGGARRVLRSGRRLWPDSSEAKTHGRDWHNVVKTSGGAVTGTKSKLDTVFHSNGWDREAKSTPVVVDIKVEKPLQLARESRFQDEKLFGIVYQRKRKSLALGVADSGKKRFGRRFERRQRRRLNSGQGLEPDEVVTIVASSSMAKNRCFAQFLCLLFVYMTRARLRLTDLFSFLASEPINGVNSLLGINLVLDHPLTRRIASCKIFGAEQFVPLFSVDFSAVPHCFINMHNSMSLRYKSQLLLRSTEPEANDESDDEELESGAIISSMANNIENRWVSNPSLRASKLLGRSTQYRNGMMSRGIQKRRSSLRRKRARNPSLSSVHKLNNGLVSDLVSFRKNGVSLSVTSNNNKIRRSTRGIPVLNLKEVSPRTDGSAQVGDSTLCIANMLVIESDKCYREKGVHVVMDMSPSGEWVIAVKKDGSTKFTHKAEKVLKPYSSNRYTHAITWAGDNSWKLEFDDRTEWIVFKDLYKECLDRNMPVPGVKVIPIPGVNEVSQNGANRDKPFCRPESYISVKGDEVSRAMSRKTASYDLESDDELWLKRFNTESFVEDNSHVHLLEDTLELMVDAFEKAYYCSTYQLSEDKPPVDLCSHLGNRKVVEAAYSYWMVKRNQKRASLLRIFQSHQVKRVLLVPRPMYRKKRSFKRQPSKVGRVKLNFLSVMPTAMDSAEEQNSRLKVEAAKSSAKRCVELAVRKRRKAQLLMQNADLATFKATSALRIAETVAGSEYPAGGVADHFLD